MTSELVGLLFVNCAFTAFVLWLVVHYRLRKSQQKLEERLRVLEGLGSGQDMVRFLESERGRGFLEQFGRRAGHPLKVVVASTAFGIVLVFVGFAFLACAWLDVWQDGETFLIPGLLCSIGGLGVLVAAAVSKRLTRSWGLIPSGSAES